ncbi:MAG: transglutaminase-like domain-containing protein [Promethearchaeota archaeon]
MNEYLECTRFIDDAGGSISSLARELTRDVDAGDVRQKATKIFYFVRDKIPYKIQWQMITRKSLRASTTLKNGHGFCIPKAILLAALARTLGIPSRLHFADIRNYRTSESLKQAMGSNLFVYHGYTELFLEGAWLKANPAFDKALCNEKDLIPVEFDGRSHGLFSKVDKHGNKFIEYVKDHGVYTDVPYSNIISAWMEEYHETWGKLQREGLLE